MTDESQISNVIKEFHDNPVGGHQGLYRTLRRIRQYYDFKNLFSKVKKHLRKCETCQVNKSGGSNRIPLRITTTAVKSFEKVALDIVGPLPLSNYGNSFLLTLQDNLTKFSMAIPLRDQKAVTVSRKFVEEYMCIFGLPESILTDQGTNFMSSVFKNMCKLLRIKKINTTAYHPESNGALENTHKTLVEYLRHFVNESSSDWDEWIKFAIFTFNTTPHTSTGYMPYELVFGFKPTIPTSITKEPEVQYCFDDYLTELKNKLQTSHQIARNNLIETKEKSKNFYDRKTKSIQFKKDDLVYLKKRNTNK